MWIFARLAVVLGRIIRANRDVHLAVELLDLADAAEDLEFSEVLHLVRSIIGAMPRLRWLSVMSAIGRDGTEAP